MQFVRKYASTYLYRFLFAVVLITCLITLFYSYTDNISEVTEQASVQQTINIINSTLTVVFSHHVVRGDLDKLNTMGGGNPFDYLLQYNVLPENYNGLTGGRALGDLAPGWYYDSDRRRVAYVPIHGREANLYTLEFAYNDVNHSGKFESGADQFQHLRFQIVR